MAQVSIEDIKAKREFDGQEYILTKIDYSEEDAKADAAWQKEQGVESKILQDGIFWLLYTKIG